MISNARDTQFQGFAKSLLREMHEPISDYWREDSQKIIARRAYDLVQHSVGHILEYLHDCGHELSGSMGSRIMPSIPDMRELPKENK